MCLHLRQSTTAKQFGHGYSYQSSASDGLWGKLVAWSALRPKLIVGNSTRKIHCICVRRARWSKYRQTAALARIFFAIGSMLRSTEVFRCTAVAIAGATDVEGTGCPRLLGVLSALGSCIAIVHAAFPRSVSHCLRWHLDCTAYFSQ